VAGAIGASLDFLNPLAQLAHGAIVVGAEFLD
jgi:hypothetical protein